MIASSLISRISEAFPVNPIPGKDAIIGKTSYPPDEDELQEVREFFANRPWTDVTPQNVFEFRLALPLFSEKALAYYTAAWMVCSLRDFDAVDTAPGDLVFCLQKADPNLWTAAQRSVICLWLERMMIPLLDFERKDYEVVVGRFGSR